MWVWLILEVWLVVGGVACNVGVWLVMWGVCVVVGSVACCGGVACNVDCEACYVAYCGVFCSVGVA